MKRRLLFCDLPESHCSVDPERCQDEYGALVFACGDAIPKFNENAAKQYNKDLMEIIRTFGDKGKVMIGHCAAGMMFEFAGITDGKKIAVHPLARPAIQKGVATDELFAIDGNFYTAQTENTVGTMIAKVVDAPEQ